MMEETNVGLQFSNFNEEEKKILADCPYSIKNPELYLQSIELEKAYKKIRYAKTTEGELIDLFTTPATLLSKAENLSEEEQMLLLKKQRAFRSLQCKAMNARKMSLDKTFKKNQASKNKMIDTLLTAKKSELIELFGRMYTVKEILTMIKIDWKVTGISEVSLRQFYNSNSEEILRLQEKHKNDYSHLRLTSKTSRIEELTYLYQKLKRKYETSENREDHKALLSTIDSIRKEVEGEKLTIQGDLNIQLQQDVNHHVRSELMKTIALKEIILSRLSSRIGISPMKLISSLSDSHYAKLNRLIGDTIDVEHEEIEFPSLQPYDFDVIKRKQEEKKKEEAEEKEREKVEKQAAEIQNKDTKDIIKEQLLAKLKQNSLKIEEGKINLKSKDI